MDELAVLVGCKPRICKYTFCDPRFAMRLFVGPNVPYVYRLQGKGRWEGAKNAIRNVPNRVKIPMKNRNCFIEPYKEDGNIDHRFRYSVLKILAVITCILLMTALWSYVSAPREALCSPKYKSPHYARCSSVHIYGAMLAIAKFDYVAVVIMLYCCSQFYAISSDGLIDVDSEEYDEYFEPTDDYGDEKMLWGKEQNPQWCDAPLMNNTLRDRFSVRNSFVEPNSKGQFVTETMIELHCGEGRRLKLNDSLIHPLRSAYLRCTFNNIALRGEWFLIGMMDYMASFTPECTFRNATIIICDAPQLNPNEIAIDEYKKARFYKHNETLILRCAQESDRLLPNGTHKLRCDQSGWIYEVNNTELKNKSPRCIPHSTCTLQKIPSYLNYAINASICSQTNANCPEADQALPIGFQISLSCKSSTLRLNGASLVTCMKSQIVEGSVWYPTKWPLCSMKHEQEIDETLVYGVLISITLTLLIILCFMIKLVREQNRKSHRNASGRPLRV
ncbi:unnamed protein product [Anisakis simplex]|uniref:Flavin-containing monooxygenase n=1 Tax=Anisakis simplex TaxID=6269 RepID=A0A0M3K097_ANISI|nr:unnamed protein product [Anisakis simplex]